MKTKIETSCFDDLFAWAEESYKVNVQRIKNESLKVEKARKLLTDDDYQMMETLGVDYVEYITHYTTYLMEV
jgi:hypothetical protein